MTNQIDLNSFSAKKYKNELYQLRLNSYLEKSEDFEESDFIESEQKYFNSCYNSVDENHYNSERVHWCELEGEMDYDIYYQLEPQIDQETFGYSCKNRSEQERLIKTFSLVLQFLSGTEKTQRNDTPEPQQNEPDEVYKTQNLFKVGLLFATGKMNKYFTIKSNNEIVANNGLSPLKIATELGNPSFEKIILASKNNYKTGENKNKNIFNNYDMMAKIIDHCKVNNLPVETYFSSRLPIDQI